MKVDSRIKQFFTNKSKQLKWQDSAHMKEIFSQFFAEFSSKYCPNWKGLNIRMATNPDKWVIINRLQTEIIQKGFKGRSFWGSLGIILDSNFICSNHDLFVITLEEQIIGYMLIKRDGYILEIISIEPGYRRRGFAYASLISLRQYYVLYDRIQEDPVRFKTLTIKNIAEEGMDFWREMKAKIKWLQFELHPSMTL